MRYSMKKAVQSDDGDCKIEFWQAWELYPRLKKFRRVTVCAITTPAVRPLLLYEGRAYLKPGEEMNVQIGREKAFERAVRSLDKPFRKPFWQLYLAKVAHKNLKITETVAA